MAHRFTGSSQAYVRGASNVVAHPRTNSPPDLRRELWDPDDSSLGTLTQLSTLKLVGSKFAEPPYVATDDHLAGLSSLTGLSALTLRDHSSLTGAGLAHLRTCTALTSLVLSGCRLLRDEHLASLAAVTGEWPAAQLPACHTRKGESRVDKSDGIRAYSSSQG